MISRRPWRRAVAVAFFALLVGSVPAVVFGHAELATVSPADRSTAQGSPDEITMTFTQNLDPAKSVIRVVNAAGSVVAEGGTVPAGSRRTLVLSLANPLSPGAYTIRWTSFSTEDSEQARGTTTFTVAAAPIPSPTPVGTPSAAPSVAPSVAPSSAPTVAPSPSAPPTAPVASPSDALIPIVFALLVLAGLGLWLLRGRSRARR